MNDCLINRYHLDENSLRKSYKQLTKPYFLVQLLISLALLGLAVFYTVRYAQYFPESKRLLLLVLLLYLLAGFELWQTLNSVNRAVRRTMRRIEETQHVREYDVTLRFEPTELVVENSLSAETGSLPYENVKSLKRREDLIVLQTLTRRVFTLDPACFENGTEADFWRLMNEKCPNAVPKEYRA